MQISAGPSRNELFDKLWPILTERVRRQAQTVTLDADAVLYEPGKRQPYCYFPTAAVISLAYQMESGIATEVATIGNEGMVGAVALAGASAMPCFAAVQQSGAALRMPAAVLRTDYERNASFAHLLLSYTLFLVDRMSQTAACNRLHDVNARLSRWLLCSQDRRPHAAELHMTHESLSHILGVRREAISHAAIRLQQAGLISYCRGRIQIRDRAGLIERACECYTPPPEAAPRRVPSPVATKNAAIRNSPSAHSTKAWRARRARFSAAGRPIGNSAPVDS